MSLAVLATVALLILPVELPDKTLVATLVLSTRYPPVAVWLGAAGAFAVQCAVAVLAGGLLGLLPRLAVELIVAGLFAVGALLLVRSVVRPEETEVDAAAVRHPASGWRAALVTFGVLFAAEWGDLSQLATAGLQARYNDPAAVFLGAWVALVTVAALAVVLGKAALRVVPLRGVRMAAAAAFGIFAAVTLAKAATG